MGRSLRNGGNDSGSVPVRGRACGETRDRQSRLRELNDRRATNKDHIPPTMPQWPPVVATRPPARSHGWAAVAGRPKTETAVGEAAVWQARPRGRGPDSQHLQSPTECSPGRPCEPRNSRRGWPPCERRPGNDPTDQRTARGA